MIPVPILFGRWLAVFATAFLLWRIIRPEDEHDLKDAALAVFWVVFGTGAAATLVILGALDGYWYPIWWTGQRGALLLRVGDIFIHLPQWFMLIRVFLLIAPPIAWYASVRPVKWRYSVEIYAPTASSVPIQQARASSVQFPAGAPVRFADPDADPDSRGVQT